MDCISWPEVVVSSGTDDNLICTVWDPKSGSVITKFKGEHTSQNCLVSIGEDYLMNGIKDKPFLEVWNWSKMERTSNRFHVPGVVTALAVSPSGHHCIAAINMRLHIWHVSTGNLLAVLRCHYSDISCIVFSSDGRYFVSAGKDRNVIVWSLHQAVRQSSDFCKENAKTLHTFSEHESSVTGLHVTKGLKSKVISCSEDGTCHVHELVSGKLVFSVFGGVPLHSVVMDSAELFLTLGAADGRLLQVKFFKCLQINSVNMSDENSVTPFGGRHKGAVTCLSSSLDAKYIVSGSDDGIVKVWCAQTRMCFSSFTHKGKVTNAYFLIAPYALLSQERTQPSVIFTRFKHSEDKTDEVLVPAKLSSDLPSTFHLDPCDQAFNRACSEGLCQEAARSKASLQRELAEHKIINEQFYSFTLGTFLNTLKPEFVEET